MPFLTSEQTDAVGQLPEVVGQDTEPDPDREVDTWRIARGVAHRSPTISLLVDPHVPLVREPVYMSV